VIRHPFYLAFCLFAVVYLATANARGWSFWHSVARPFSSTGGSGGRSGYYGGFNHK
jgi:hypothetical protein